MKDITIFTGSKGINTKIDPNRIHNAKSGISDFAVGADVDVSETGRTSRRKGYTKQASGSFHSLFCDGGECLIVTGTDLCILNPDYSYEVIGTVTAGARVSACQATGKIYYCNGYEKGIVKDSVVLPWVKGTYVGPATTRTLAEPPIGTLVEYYRTRMYIAQGRTLWFSEPLNFGAFDLVRGFFLFNTNIRMVRAVKEGIYVSTEKNVYFLAGKIPSEMQRLLVAAYPAMQYSETKFRGVLSMQKSGPTIYDSGEESLMWMSKEGVCYGGNDGSFFNLTEKKVTGLPEGVSGSGLVANGRYIGLINP